MKKLLTLISTLAVVAALSVPAFSSKSKGNKESTGTASTTQTKPKGKSHAMHSRKKGSTTGKKKGQASTIPGSGK